MAGTFTTGVAAQALFAFGVLMPNKQLPEKGDIPEPSYNHGQKAAAATGIGCPQLKAARFVSRQ
ncbi:hypothetical protein ACFYXC_37150 [Streptomyces sp. NPDC002701]|uniref:hypothetical protein n=1 Tax=Streptomyces sp. NPDC002701 TaxID=3364661 RepID=UPI00367AF1E4